MEHLIKVIAKSVKFHLDILIDVSFVVKNIPGIKQLLYSDIDFETCNCSKYFK